MGEILMGYERALLIEGSDSSDTNQIIIQLEEQFKKKGFFKAFAIGAVACSLCIPCTIDTECQHPEKARPTLQACGIDMRSTIFKNGWGTPHSQPEPCSPENNIAMLLVN